MSYGIYCVLSIFFAPSAHSLHLPLLQSVCGLPCSLCPGLRILIVRLVVGCIYLENVPGWFWEGSKKTFFSLCSINHTEINPCMCFSHDWFSMSISQSLPSGFDYPPYTRWHQWMQQGRLKHLFQTFLWDLLICFLTSCLRLLYLTKYLWKSECF